jgi:hypothetical protein
LLAGSCGGTNTSLAAYAAGDWTCGLEAVGEPDIPSPFVTATVTASTDTSGRVEITFPWWAEAPELMADQPPPAGEWRLEGDDLSVNWDHEKWGAADVDSVALDTEDIRTRSGTSDEDPQWVDVEVERDGDTITFAWEDPFEQDSPLTRLHCEQD